jgi:chromosome segregation ATPase
MMTRRVARILRAVAVGIALFCMVPGRGYAAEKNDAGSSSVGSQLDRVRLESAQLRDSVNKYKKLYEEKDAEIKALNGKIDKLQGNFQNLQDLYAKLSKEKESLDRQQSELAIQLKQIEGQKLILEKQNQILNNCSKDNEAKSIELAFLNSASKGERQRLQQELDRAREQLNGVSRDAKDASVRTPNSRRNMRLFLPRWPNCSGVTPNCPSRECRLPVNCAMSGKR